MFDITFELMINAQSQTVYMKDEKDNSVWYSRRDGQFILYNMGNIIIQIINENYNYLKIINICNIFTDNENYNYVAILFEDGLSVIYKLCEDSYELINTFNNITKIINIGNKIAIINNVNKLIIYSIEINDKYIYKNDNFIWVINETYITIIKIRKIPKYEINITKFEINNSLTLYSI